MNENTNPTEFIDFGKMARWSRDIIITEKIDGTNGQIHIRPFEDGSSSEEGFDTIVEIDGAPHYLRAGSRNRWLGHGKQLDNFGFAAWVAKNANDLATLGVGRHFGEWWGQGIGAKYDLTERRFSLFNVSRWLYSDARPACCGVVPLLYRGPNSDEAVEVAIKRLREYGSLAAPGFMKPEGVIVWHTAANIGFKKTLVKDELNKWQIAATAEA